MFISWFVLLIRQYLLASIQNSLYPYLSVTKSQQSRTKQHKRNKLPVYVSCSAVMAYQKIWHLCLFSKSVSDFCNLFKIINTTVIYSDQRWQKIMGRIHIAGQLKRFYSETGFSLVLLEYSWLYFKTLPITHGNDNKTLLTTLRFSHRRPIHVAVRHVKQ